MPLDLSFITRKKTYDEQALQETKLSRVLNLVDITAIGISCTLGNGIYVLAGKWLSRYASFVLFFVLFLFKKS